MYQRCSISGTITNSWKIRLILGVRHQQQRFILAERPLHCVARTSNSYEIKKKLKYSETLAQAALNYIFAGHYFAQFSKQERITVGLHD